MEKKLPCSYIAKLYLKEKGIEYDTNSCSAQQDPSTAGKLEGMIFTWKKGGRTHSKRETLVGVYDLIAQAIMKSQDI